jgi:hypothetical protein
MVSAFQGAQIQRSRWNGSSHAICSTIATMEMAKSHIARTSRRGGPENRWKKFLSEISRATHSSAQNRVQSSRWP